MGVKYTCKQAKDIFKGFGYDLLNENYKNSKTKMTAINTETGYLIYINLEFLMNNNGTARLWHKTNPYSIYNINLYFKNNKINIRTFDDEYVNLKHKMKWKCSICGEQYLCGLGHIISDKKYYCNKCGNEKSINSRIKSYDLQDVFIKNGLKPIIRSDSTRHTNITAVNNEGYLIYTSYYNIKNGANPKVFDVNNPYTIYNINNYIKINKMSCTLISDEYLNSTSKLKFKCSCGNVYETSLTSFTSQKVYRCKKCSRSKSNGELLVENWLSSNGFKFMSEYKFKDCILKRALPFDICVLDNDTIVCLIEIDGIQHYEPCKIFGGNDRYMRQLKVDKIKDDYCKDNGINLIRIPYWEFKDDGYKKILKNELTM